MRFVCCAYLDLGDLIIKCVFEWTYDIKLYPKTDNNWADFQMVCHWLLVWRPFWPFTFDRLLSSVSANIFCERTRTFSDQIPVPLKISFSKSQKRIEIFPKKAIFIKIFLYLLAVIFWCQVFWWPEEVIFYIKYFILWRHLSRKVKSHLQRFRSHVPGSFVHSGWPRRTRQSYLTNSPIHWSPYSRRTHFWQS